MLRAPQPNMEFLVRAAVWRAFRVCVDFLGDGLARRCLVCCQVFWFVIVARTSAPPLSSTLCGLMLGTPSQNL